MQNNLPFAVDITECGTNALNAIFDILEFYDNPVQVYLSHRGIVDCEMRDFLVNNKVRAKTVLELGIALKQVKVE
jgi:hypothetical protein